LAASHTVPAVAIMSSIITTSLPSTSPMMLYITVVLPLVRRLSIIARSQPFRSAYIRARFTLPTSGLTSTHFFKIDFKEVVLVSPDVGNVKRARMYAERNGCDLAIIDKRRTSGSTTVMYNIIGEVEGKDVVMIDDMIATAGTVCEAAKIVKERGARSVRAAATHAVFAGPALDRLEKAPFTQIAVADTIPVPNEARQRLPNLIVLSVAEILGEAIAAFTSINREQSFQSRISEVATMDIPTVKAETVRPPAHAPRPIAQDGQAARHCVRHKQDTVPILLDRHDLELHMKHGAHLLQWTWKARPSPADQRRAVRSSRGDAVHIDLGGST